MAYRHVIPNAYAIAMAVLPEQREVILVGQPNGNKAGTVACIAAIGLDAPYQMKGPWPRPRTTMISCVIALPGHQQFATGGSCYPFPLPAVLQQHECQRSGFLTSYWPDTTNLVRRLPTFHMVCKMHTSNRSHCASAWRNLMEALLRKLVGGVPVTTGTGQQSHVMAAQGHFRPSRKHTCCAAQPALSPPELS